MPPSKYTPAFNVSDNNPAHPPAHFNALLQNTLAALGYLNTKCDHAEDSYAYGAPAPSQRNQPHTAR